MHKSMKEEEVLYYQSGNIITCIIYHKSNKPLQFIKKNFIGFNQTVITDLEYSNLTKMRPIDAKNYFVQLWSKYNKDYFSLSYSNSTVLLLWKITRIGNYVEANGIAINIVKQAVTVHNISHLNLNYDVEISTEDYNEILQLSKLDSSLGFIQAVVVFTKYTGKTIDEISESRI